MSHRQIITGCSSTTAVTPPALWDEVSAHRDNMQSQRTTPNTALATSEATHRLQAGSFDLQGEAELKSIVSGIIISKYVPPRSLRLSDKLRPYMSIVTVDKAFSVSASMVWNELSFSWCAAPYANSFKRNLFSIAYTDHSQ